jgi:hypothetical protein
MFVITENIMKRPVDIWRGNPSIRNKIHPNNLLHTCIYLIIIIIIIIITFMAKLKTFSISLFTCTFTRASTRFKPSDYHQTFEALNDLKASQSLVYWQISENKARYILNNFNIAFCLNLILLQQWKDSHPWLCRSGARYPKSFRNSMNL